MTDEKLPTLPAKPQRISKTVRAAIESMVAGRTKTITAAAAEAGISRENLSRAFAKPHIVDFIRQRVNKNLALAAARAGAVKVDLLDCDSLHVRNDASEFILGLAGIKPASGPAVSVNLQIKAGWVIDLSDDPKVIPHV